MLDFLGKRLQKSIDKIRSKTTLTENDIVTTLREIKISLLEADVNLLVVKEFVAEIKSKALNSEIVGKLNPSQQVIKIVKDELVKILGHTTKEINLKAKLPVIMLVGLQGSGKTTTTAKVARYLIKKQGFSKPLMVAADVYRPAAIEQLQTLGKQLQIDVYTDSNKDPVKIASNSIAKAKASDYDCVLIDTAGRLAINEELMLELQTIKSSAKPHEILFVADAMSGQDVINVASAFHKRLSLTGTIITKLDSDTRGGAVLSITKLLNLPVVFIGVGEKISAINLFHPDRMADRILGMGDVLSLIEKAQEVIDEKKSKQIINRMVSGSFNLDDLINQLEQVKKLGKFSKILKMIPGAANKISETQVNKAESKMKLYSILISSMTKSERKNPRLLKNPTRKKRVVVGSGRSNQEFNALLNDFDRMAKQMKAISKSIKDGTFNPNMMKEMNF